MKTITNTIITLATFTLISAMMRVIYQLSKEVSTLFTAIPFICIALFMVFLLYVLVMLVVHLWAEARS